MTDWNPLDQELARWNADGLSLPLWWRDDDAIEPTPALNRLSALSDATGLPVHLAVIPANATQALADDLSETMIPVVHGWAHQNNAPADQKKAEFGAHRPVSTMQAQAQDAHSRLRDLFGSRLQPMFVPPWNRIAPDMVAALPEAGFTMLSTYTPRKQAQAAPGLTQINTHLDPIDWRGTRSAVDTDQLIAQLTTQLADRREGRADTAEPYGILTHHLVHDDAIWDITAAILDRLLSGPARPWTATSGDIT